MGKSYRYLIFLWKYRLATVNFGTNKGTYSFYKVVLLIMLMPYFLECTDSWAVSGNSTAMNSLYGENISQQAKLRINDWQEFIEKNKDKPDLEKVKLVNNYFNKMKFVNDINLWQQSDYWATPSETLVIGAGDCEDYAIAKYFSLRLLGVAEEHLRITYTKIENKGSIDLDSHMVLIYKNTNNGDPVMLDVLTNKINQISEISGVELVYSFNTQGVWLWKDNLQTIAYGGPDMIENWSQLHRQLQQQLQELMFSGS